MLRAFNAYFRWTFSSTVLHDSLLDLRGYLYFHERPFWDGEVVRNLHDRPEDVERNKRSFSCAERREARDHGANQAGGRVV
jgi:hypothetical protein